MATDWTSEERVLQKKVVRFAGHFQNCAMTWSILWPSLSAYPSLLNNLHCLVCLLNHFGFRIYWRTLKCPVMPPYMPVCVYLMKANLRDVMVKFLRGVSQLEARQPRLCHFMLSLAIFWLVLRRVRITVKTSIIVVISVRLHETIRLPVAGFLWNLTRITGTLHEDLCTVHLWKYRAELLLQLEIL